MQNSTKLFSARLACLTMIFFCANYGSMYAQGERKAFEEGDKILSIGLGVGNGYGPTYFGYGNYFPGAKSSLAPSISFDYGLKGTRGIVSVGGFLSYSQVNFSDSEYYTFPFINQPNTKDSVNYAIINSQKFKQHTITAGLRFGLHYSTRRWDLYAGVLVGYRLSFNDSRTLTTDNYKGILSQSGFSPRDGKFLNTETVNYSTNNSGQIILSPYAGARYYVTPKVSLNLEVGQHTGNIGIGFKF
jgi:hypothetical protein